MKLLNNSGWNILALSFTLGSQFVIVPFVISYIGLAEFGYVGLLLATWAPLLLVGTVLGQSAVRLMSERSAKGDIRGVLNASESVLYLCVVLSLICGFIYVISGELIFGFLKGRENALYELGFVAISGISQQIYFVLQSYAIARQDFKLIAILTATSMAISTFLIFIIVRLNPTAVGYLAGIAAGFSGTVVIWLTVIIKRYGSIRFCSHKKDRQEIFYFGRWQTLSQLAGTIANQIDRYVLSIFSTLFVIGQYNAANRIQESAYIGVIKATEVLFPYFGSNSNQDIYQQARVYLISSWVVMTFSSTLLVPIIPLSYPILNLWVGVEVANGGAVLLSILVAGGLIGCGTNVYTYFAMGTGQNKPLAWISVIYSLLAIVFTFIAIYLFGPYAAGSGLLIAGIVRVIVSLTVVKKLYFTFISLSKLIASTVLPLLASMFVAFIWWKLVDFQEISWVYLLVFYLLISLSTVGTIVVSLLLTQWGRNLFSEFMTYLKLKFN